MSSTNSPNKELKRLLDNLGEIGANFTDWALVTTDVEEWRTWVQLLSRKASVPNDGQKTTTIDYYVGGTDYTAKDLLARYTTAPSLDTRSETQIRCVSGPSLRLDLELFFAVLDLRPPVRRFGAAFPKKVEFRRNGGDPYG